MPTPAPGAADDDEGARPATAAPQTDIESAPPSPPAQPRNPLHGLTLEALLKALVAHFGWPGLAEQVPVRCFSHQPSIKSSLAFLRRTPWAREKVESLYLFMLREQRRAPKLPGTHSPRR